MEIESCEALQTKLSDSLEEKCFNNAMQICSVLELALAENIDISQDSNSQFYDIYMALFIINDDLNGARYLWKRSPSVLKDGRTHLADLWAVASLLFNQDTSIALVKINETSWVENILPLVQEMSSRIRFKMLRVLAKSFSNPSIGKIAASLSTTIADATEDCAKLNWKVDASGLVTSNTPCADRTAHIESLEESLAMMKDLSAYVAHFETKSLGVDLTGKVSIDTAAAKK